MKPWPEDIRISQRFDEKHRSSLNVGDLKFTSGDLEWVCTCGYKFSKLNCKSVHFEYKDSRIAHYEAVKNTLVKEIEDEIEEALNNLSQFSCNAYRCRNTPIGLVQKYGNRPYCQAHINAFIAGGTKHSEITFAKGVEKIPDALNTQTANIPAPAKLIAKPNSDAGMPSSLSIKARAKIEEKDTKQLLAKATNVKPKVFNKKFVASIAILVLLVGGYFYNLNEEAKAREAQRIANVELSKKCFDIHEEDAAAKAGFVGSTERYDATLAFYKKVAASPCVIWGDGSVLRNIYEGVNENSPTWDSFASAFTYTLNRWNGLEPIIMRCQDGWASPSIGSQGACSHHGGVTSGFSTKVSQSLAGRYSSALKLFNMSDLEK